MQRLSIVGGEVYAPERLPAGAVILIEDGRIIYVGPADAASLPGPPTPILDAGGLIIAPGLIDLQLNGGFGHDFTQAPASISLVASRLPATGVTSFVPTIITAPLARSAEALAFLRTGGPACPPAAHVLGLHFEGPYINPRRAGAHPPAHIVSPAEADLRAWEPLDHIRLVTLAPELPGASALMRRLQDAGVAVSAGHSAATYDEARRAFDAGVRCVTHLFNAMSPWHHREPGLAGAALDDERVRVGLVADGLHLHPAVLRAAWRIKGAGAIALVTDAMAAMGEPAGDYRLGDQIVTVDAGRGARLADGTLAGSLLTMDQALRNVVAWTGCRLDEALRAASTTPAAILGLHERKGRLAAGYDADILLLTPDLHVAGALIAGETYAQTTQSRA
jgi:N-acetylglucosamine-6-phosphate deacetylase